MTLNEGHAALHQSIVGDRLRLALDVTLSERVAGRRLAHPMLVCDVSIGQSTLPTQRVIGNLSDRRLTPRRLPAIGDTLEDHDGDRRAEAQHDQGGPQADRPGGPAHRHEGPGRARDPRLLALRDAPDQATSTPRSRTPTTSISSRPTCRRTRCTTRSTASTSTSTAAEVPGRHFADLTALDDVGSRGRRQRHRGALKARAHVAEPRQGALGTRLALTPASASSTAGTRSASRPRTSPRRCPTS